MAGIVLSAIMGGLAGLAYSTARDHSVLESILAYQIGGTIAVLGFVALAQAAHSSKDQAPARLD